MKRLFVLITMIALIIASACKLDAQVTARTALDNRSIRKSVTYYKYTGVAADTCGTEQDTLYFSIRINKDGPVNVNARINATRTGSTETYDMDLEGKVFLNDSWSKVNENATQTASKSLYQPETSLVDSVQTTVTGINANAMPGSGPNFYRYWRVFVGNDGTCGAADKLTINSVEWKIYIRK